MFYVYSGTNLNLSFLLSKKYDIFCCEKLHTDRIQHYLRHDIFFNFFFEVSEFEFLEL
jgi:hypothetical protein